MSTEDKIRLGMLALAAISTVVATVHFGHTGFKPPFLDELGGIGSM